LIELSHQFPTSEVLERIAAAFEIESYLLFAVPPSPENSMERLHKDIIREIREVVVEVLEKALADKHNSVENICLELCFFPSETHRIIGSRMRRLQ